MVDLSNYTKIKEYEDFILYRHKDGYNECFLKTELEIKKENCKKMGERRWTK